MKTASRPLFPLALTLLFLSLCACRRSGLPDPGSKQYADLVHAFNIGLAGLQSGADIRAKEGLTQATQIAPGEPAPWADLGILAVRQQELDSAYQDFETARRLAPDNSHIEQLLGDLESRRGKLPEAIQHLKHAVKLDQKNVKALYMLAEQTERQGSGANDGEARDLFRKILDQYPNNAAALLEVARLSAKTGNTDVLKSAVASLVQQSAAWPDEAKQQVQALSQAASGADPRSAALQVAFLRNLLLRVPQYRRDADVVKTPVVFVGDPFLRFIKLPSPPDEVAEPDNKLNFAGQALAGIPQSGVLWMRSAYLDDGGKPSVLWADASGVHTSDGAVVAIPGGKTGVNGLTANCVALADLNYDFKTDIVVAGPGGVRIYQQETPQRFVDVTSKTHLPPNVINGTYAGVWPLDVDLDGDLDLVLAVKGGAPLVLRNNADGTFVAQPQFAGVTGGISFATADIDGNGDPDVAMVGDDGKLTVFMNERFGNFHARTVPSSISGGVVAVAAGDVNGDGAPDFIILKSDGSIERLSDKDGVSWETAELAKAHAQVAGASIDLADFDNNGTLDLLLSDGEVFLGSQHGFSALPASPALISASPVDMDGDGRIDIIGLSKGQPSVLTNHGVKNYHWQTIRTRAANAHGDQRINSFGIGGEIEIRAGLLAEKQIITSPVLHFGLGEHPQTDLARIVWPNGLIQVEFELSGDQSVLATQRLKGSCPALFAWDGREMHFVKDGAPWSPALGLHINAQQVAGISQTREWFKIPGREVAPRDGSYDLRVTAELWETFYIDYYSLLVVDHPRDTEVYSDERFSVPPPKLKLYTTGISRPFKSAIDDQGQDVSAIVRDIDQNYLDDFGRGQYQGVTRDHWVELELPEDAPRTGTLYLLAEGWMHPTDATVNIAMGQTSNPPPQGLRIEVIDAKGHWVVAQSGLGFLAGKLKTAMFDISKIFKPGAPRKLRLGTNLEIYWDRLAWAPGVSDSVARTQPASLTSAELRHRGYSVMTNANQSSPEIPNYSQLSGTSQKWRDLEGYYTRLGDVRELLEKVDDRMVIVAAGDEIRLRFAAPDAPPAGWVRDLIMVGDGWIKDGDYNSVFSQTVLPLPYHGMKDYTVPPGKLEDDPAYRMHPDDWQKYHTRYIAPDVFRTALWNK